MSLETICETVSRPTMRFVPVKTPDEQAACIVLKTRELFVRQRSQAANAIRAHMAELGIIAAAGMTGIAKLILILRDAEDARLPVAARAALLQMAEQIEMLTARIENLDSKIVATVKADEIARRLNSIPGVGTDHRRDRPSHHSGCLSIPNWPRSRRLDRDHSASSSGGGKERLGRISKRVNKQLRTLLILGATSILKQARRGVKLSWIISPIPSDSVRLRARESDKAIGVADIIVARVKEPRQQAGHMTAPPDGRLCRKEPCQPGRSTYESEPKFDADGVDAPPTASMCQGCGIEDCNKMRDVHGEY